MCLYTRTRKSYAKSNNDISQAHMRLDRRLARSIVCASLRIKPRMYQQSWAAASSLEYTRKYMQSTRGGACTPRVRGVGGDQHSTQHCAQYFALPST